MTVAWLLPVYSQPAGTDASKLACHWRDIVAVYFFEMCRSGAGSGDTCFNGDVASKYDVHGLHGPV